MKKTIFALLFCIVALGVAGQSNPTATLSGKVTTDGVGLPGVNVTLSSASLQGARVAVTTAAGDYLFPFLPPGNYTVTFELEGMQTVNRTVSLAAARTDKLNVALVLSTVTETITVTAETPLTAAIQSTQVATNFKQDLIDSLPVSRSLDSVTLLAPGVNDNGPSYGGRNLIMISGAMAYDSLYLVNGAIVNENLRGWAHDLFIEDAIQETTVMSGAISAEYGHFTGGVVNAVTRSGGNEFKGSFRTSFSQDSWTEPTPLTTDQLDDLNKVYEATLGGRIMRDRLWFFGAGRSADRTITRQTVPGLARQGDQDAAGNQLEIGTQIPPITYPYGNDETRLEGKLTAAITPRHSFIASYIDIDEAETNQTGSSVMDLDSLVARRTTPNTLLALNYNGVLTDQFFLEAQYSKKEFAFLGSGSPYFDLIKGTLVLDRARGTRYWSPTFRVKPEGERRDHELYTVKGSYFLSTDSFGTHDIKLGYENFLEVRNVNNYQNGSDFRVSLSQTIIRGNVIYPRVRNTSSYTRIYWYPIFVPSQGSEYGSDSLFLNDRWTLNNRWSFNLGLRYDKNDAISGDHTFQIADDSAFSPRFAAHYDIRGDGRFMATASFGQYVGRLAEGVGNDGDPAGRTASFNWSYRGPAINTDVNTPTADLVPTDVALQTIFDWFFANGGTDMRPTRTAPSIPGLASILDPNGLTSPNVKEYTLGFGMALGSRGYARADYIHRTWDDFYIQQTDMSTGQVEDNLYNTGRSYDLTIVKNDSDIYNREYNGIQTQFSYRFTDRFSFGGTYTWSRLVGNVTGENGSSGPLSGVAGEYPEYREESWNYPTGYLTGDQRHRARLYASYDLPTPVGDFNFSLLQNFDSGTRTSADGTIDSRPYVDNPGYLTPVSGISYFFGGRGNLSTEDITRTDFALNYSFKFKTVELFIQPEVLNLFNEKGITSYNEEVLTEDDEDWLAPFNPFTETPIECPQGASPQACIDMGAHWQKGVNFGKPDSEGDYQLPRTFRVSVGLRF